MKPIDFKKKSTLKKYTNLYFIFIKKLWTTLRPVCIVVAKPCNSVNGGLCVISKSTGQCSS